jgi:hypothetical protein
MKVIMIELQVDENADISRILTEIEHGLDCSDTTKKYRLQLISEEVIDEPF